jgi:hypothetical protein
MVGELRNVRAAEDSRGLMKSFWIGECLLDLREKREVEAICEVLACFIDVVTPNLIHISLNEAVENYMLSHYFSNEARNSLRLIPLDGSASSSASRRRASETPSSSDGRTGGNDPKSVAASFAL